MMYFIDIASYQAGINLGQVRREGFSGVIIKATEGTGYVNPYYAQHARTALDVGLVNGFYHWLKYGNGRAQADYFINRVRQIGDPSRFALVCDNEDNADWQTTIDFFARMRELVGSQPVIMYTGLWWWGARGWNGASLTPHLWHSRYVDGAGPASTLYAKVPDSWWQPNYGNWARATMLQFSSHGQVAGMTVDVNAYQGTVNEFVNIITAGIGAILMSFEEKDPHGSLSGDGSYGTYMRHLTAGILRGDTGMPGATENSVPARLARVEASVVALLEKPAAMVVLTAQDREAIISGVVSQMAPMLGEVTQALNAIRKLTSVLGEVGDVQGRLNDE